MWKGDSSLLSGLKKKGNWPSQLNSSAEKGWYPVGLENLQSSKESFETSVRNQLRFNTQYSRESESESNGMRNPENNIQRNLHKNELRNPRSDNSPFQKRNFREKKWKL